MTTKQGVQAQANISATRTGLTAAAAASLQCACLRINGRPPAARAPPGSSPIS